MFDLPLHPVVVHFPIVLGTLLPVLAFILWATIKKGYLQQRVWVLVAIMALAYGATSLIAMELGEKDEDKVEEIVSERVIEEHEEAAEMIPWVAGTLFLVSFAGLIKKNSHSLRLGLAALSLVALIPLVDAGHTGGELVYQYGAATAHMPADQQARVYSSGKLPIKQNDSDKDSDIDHDD
ncbi:MAG: hypothetical protein HOH38_11195 [Nitrospinaceae bacterium]|nr:hypothetical protein [Nitrospina sp.]MBT5869393.1 hypothetical protein [Nitrospinaceae bacterium]MBT6347161.1 hypothetical protein [Nitrospina sp.]